MATISFGSRGPPTRRIRSWWLVPTRTLSVTLLSTSLYVGPVRLFASLAYLTQCEQTGENCPTPPPNDECESAEAVDAFPFETESSFGVGSVGFNATGSCYLVDDFSGTVWYSITAETDKCVVATATTSDDSYLVLALLSGSDCESLECRTQREGYRSSSISWRVEAGEEYLLAVGSPSWSNADTFSLTVEVSIACRVCFAGWVPLTRDNRMPSASRMASVRTPRSSTRSPSSKWRATSSPPQRRRMRPM